MILTSSSSIKALSRSSVVILGLALPCQAQSDAEASLGARESLIPELFGARESLTNHGIDLRLESTHFYFGDVDSSGAESLEYGGKADLFFSMDGQKAGLWPGLFFNVHGEYRYGERSDQAGALSPVNSAMITPDDEGDVFAFTNVVITQALSESLLFSFGSFNTIDLADKTFLGGTGTEGFMNLSMVAPPIAGRTIPISTLGAFMTVLDDGKPVFNFGIIDADSPDTSAGFDGLSADEMTFLADYTFYTKLGGLDGTHTFAGSYSTIDSFSLDGSDYLRPPGAPGVTPALKDDSWQVNYTFEQYLCQRADDPTKGLGLFGILAWSDGNPNPIEFSAVLGIGGNGMNPARPNDNFGLGLFMHKASSDLEETLSPVIGLQDEYGAEFYYDAEIFPGFRLGADIQWVRPLVADNQDALFMGLRSRLVF